MKKYIMCAAMMLSTSTMAATELETAITNCTTITDETSRLVCYDKSNNHHLNDLSNQINTIITDSNKGNWSLEERIDPLDNSKKVLLFLDAVSGTNKWGNVVYMVAICHKNKTNLQISWGEYLGRDYASVKHRVGNDKLMNTKWDVSSNYKASFHRSPISLLKQMEKSNKFVVQTTPYMESPITAVFDTTGLSEALIPLREACNW